MGWWKWMVTKRSSPELGRIEGWGAFLLTTPKLRFPELRPWPHCHQPPGLLHLQLPSLDPTESSPPRGCCCDFLLHPTEHSHVLSCGPLSSARWALTFPSHFLEFFQSWCSCFLTLYYLRSLSFFVICNTLNQLEWPHRSYVAVAAPFQSVMWGIQSRSTI